MRIGDLPKPVTAAKVDWLPGTTWLGFNPQGKGPNAKALCERTGQKQFNGGFVLERVAAPSARPTPLSPLIRAFWRTRNTPSSLMA